MRSELRPCEFQEGTHRRRINLTRPEGINDADTRFHYVDGKTGVKDFRRVELLRGAGRCASPLGATRLQTSDDPSSAAREPTSSTRVGASICSDGRYPHARARTRSRPSSLHGHLADEERQATQEEGSGAHRPARASRHDRVASRVSAPIRLKLSIRGPIRYPHTKLASLAGRGPQHR